MRGVTAARELVEEARPEWRVDRLRLAWDREEVAGHLSVGAALLAWRFERGRGWLPPFTTPGHVGVAHATPVQVEALKASGIEPPVYAVRILTTPTPPGGQRWWFECPGCEQRAVRLYLPVGRERLGCRRCCGLVYRSQYPRRKRRRRR